MIPLGTVTLTLEEYNRLVEMANTIPQNMSAIDILQNATVEKPKRKVSAYSRRYGREYKRLRRKFTLKSGKLKKGYSHKRLVKLAHAAAKKVKK